MKPVRRIYRDGRFGQVHGRLAMPPESSVKRPILFIHMSPMTGRIFEALVGRMGEDRLAVAFDTPGYGHSDAPSAQPSIETYAEALFEVMDLLAPDTPFDVMGYHTGSLTATALAARFPERVGRLVLIGAPLFTPDERIEFKSYYGPKPPSADGEHLARRWRGFVHHYRRPGMSLDEVAEHFEEALTGGANAWWGHAAAFDYDLGAALGALAHPTLVLKTGDDLAVQTEQARGLSPHLEMLEVPGWGHGFATRESGEVATLLRAWLDAEDPAARAAALVAPPSARGPCWPPQDSGSFAPD